jgi:2-amino-4-hydroxy-6-hydroxymethyldihydropteridine diphosphokinase
VIAYLGLGANLGDRAAALSGALRALAATPGIEVLRVSGLYETEPQGLTGQPWFLNCVAEVRTSLDPQALLRACQAVELAFGRERTVRWGPRTLDVDVLLYGEAILDTPELRVPHPRLHQRAFALVPLCELAPDVGIPGRGPARGFLAAVADQQVRRVTP